MDKEIIHKILIAYDFSECANRAMDMGTAIAAKFGAETIVVNVINARDIDAIEHAVQRAILAKTAETPEDMVDHFKEERLERLEHVSKPYQKNGRRFKLKIRVGDPVQEILNLAQTQDVDMIVMGARGHSRIARLLTGSKAESLFRISNIPILSVRREGEF